MSQGPDRSSMAGRLLVPVLWRRTRLRTRATPGPRVCGQQTSILAGTLFHCCKLPLVVAFRIIYLIVAEKSGTNAMAISRQTGVSHRTALLWVRKVRSTMERRPREKLSGKVEVDETVVGGKTENMPGRQLGPNQCYVVVLAEDKGKKGMGRVRLESIVYASKEELCGAIEKNVEPGSEVATDGWPAYVLNRHRYVHDRRKISKSGKKAHESLPLTHLVASLLKRWIGGVLHGSWKRHWLPLVLTDFEFRINRRRSRRRPLLFHRVLECGIGGRPLTRVAYAELGRVLACA